MHFHVIHSEPGAPDIRGGRVYRLFQRTGFAGKANKYFSVTAYDSSIVASGFEQGVTLVVRNV
jgi:hypothetical protein